ncbi:MAG: NADH-quinone oxidoreductase subunit N [Leptospiraceae bacterium]|nr:NADH-quinone oxidoreductase subunit N [Leptospiraceae bacterium]
MVFTPNSIDLLSILPALILSGVGLFFLLIQFVYHSNDHRVIRYLTGTTLLVALYFVIFNYNTKPGKGLFFNNQVAVNDITMWLNVIYMVTAFLTVIASPRILNQHGITFPEFYPLMLFAVTGMYFMTSGADLVVIFVGLELLSISLYVLIGMAHNEMGSLEATLKYFLLGAFSSGFMLMGIAFLFGGSGSTQMDIALKPLSMGGEVAMFSKIGFGLFLVGVCFKVALAPFHSWTPDVYEGALTTITGFMASGPKAAAMGLMLILFQYVPMVETPNVWMIIIGGIAALSMTLGNVFALQQDNLKRVLAYSSISHAGYVVAGIVCGAKMEVIYYLMMYSFMNIAAFSIIAYLENGKYMITYDSIKYLVGKKPLTAVGLLAIFFSLGGIPPLGGFWTKLFLFQKIAESDHFLNRFLLIVGVINSAIAIYYYLRVTVSAFMTEDKGDAASEPLSPSFGLSFATVISLLFVLFSWILFQPNSL